MLHRAETTRVPIGAALLLALWVALGCASTAPIPGDPSLEEQDDPYAEFRAAEIRSILIVPALNNSVQIDAPDYFLSTIAMPVAERGYYVFPVNMVKRIMEDEGLSDAGLVHASDPRMLADLFGADAILYVTLDRWDAKYIVLSTTVTVEFVYTLKDGESGQTLWEEREIFAYTPQSQSSGNALADVLIMAIQAAATKARPNYIPLAHQANESALNEDHEGLPAGPYHPQHGLDRNRF